jgi:glycerol-3-phosphate acyltransferase PlsY
VPGIVLPILAFALGSIPFGLILVRLRGVDIRTVGSGNIGATNVLRSQGKALGILTLGLDLVKGLAPVLLALRVAPEPPWVVPATAVAAVLGHCFSPWLRGRGGKGVATGLGVFLGMAPLATLVVLAAFIAVVARTRYVSLGSIVAALGMPVAVAAMGYPWPAAVAAAVTGVVITARHRDNVVRLLKGRESRLGAGRSPTPEGGA